MVAVSPFAAPKGRGSQDAALKDGEASFWSAYDTIALGSPGAHESCDSFAVRIPQGRRGFIRSSRPPGTARHHADMRMAPLLWASQEPTNVATVWQFAAPRDGEASF